MMPAVMLVVLRVQAHVERAAAHGGLRLRSALGWTSRWAALLLGAVLLTTGCASAPGRGGTWSHDARAARALRQEAGGAPSLLGSQVSRAHPAEGGVHEGAGGSEALPPGWPDFSSGESNALLAPFLACASPEEFVTLQRRVDMPRLVEALDDWSAVRLGALGPLSAEASAVLTRKRAAFLLSATERYGPARAEVFALFVLHSAFDDELRELLRLLAGWKQLGETLGRMGSVREQLGQRGLRLSDFADRAEQPKDVLRGLGRAARDALSSSPMSDGARYLELSTRRGQLPPPYQRALDEAERAQMEAAFSPGSVALGSFDALTFGVPLGFYHLAAGVGQGTHSLSQGHFEQATRELAPAALLVGLYAGGKGLRTLAEATGAKRGGGRRLQLPQLHLEGLKEVVQRLVERLGADGMGELARYIQASREAALLVCEGGEAAALALYEARGNVARAQAWLSEAKPQRVGSTSTRAEAGKSPGGTSPRGEPVTDTPIRNAHLAGKRHPVTGVPFDAEGYPDFRAAGVVKVEVRITLTGSRTRDFAAANKAAGLRETPKGMTWHHHQDRTTMQLVPTDIHAKTGHTGGFSGGQ